MKRRMILLLSLLLLAAAPMTAFAGEWRWNHQRGWYYVNDDGSSPYDGWMWIDGRCYCFDAEGFLYTDTVTPDGYAVNQDGAWIVNGIVQEQGKPVNTKVQVTPWFSFEAPESWEGKYFWRVNEDRCVTFYSTANEAYGGQIFSILARGLDEEDSFDSYGEIYHICVIEDEYTGESYSLLYAGTTDVPVDTSDPAKVAEYQSLKDSYYDIILSITGPHGEMPRYQGKAY